MAPIKDLLNRIIYVFDILTGSCAVKTKTSTDLQNPLQVIHHQPLNHPVWTPPDDLQDPTFQCEYPSLSTNDGWTMCNTNTNRQCWLNNTRTGQQYNITTDYETNGPKGIIRQYYLELTENPLNPDGFGPVFAQSFNNSLPGPRIQACWGDQIEITVKNTLPVNGTTVHWHGLRQWNTGWNDGVNAITQCPIPPGESLTYRFNATQYGTSWYHSHYSLQYAAGLLGPLTLYGPSSANYDHQVQPIIMSDWAHQSVYLDTTMNNTLQNGIGHWPPTIELDVDVAYKFNEISFQQGVHYLIRLVNGAADTSFVFSIDNHTFQVISADFVAIEPYKASHINVGIGQRYNIIVEAVPDIPSQDGNYWIRTIPALKCSGQNLRYVDGLTGIVRYGSSTKMPSTKRKLFDIDCADETYNKTLTPKVPWNIDTSSMIDMAHFNLYSEKIPKQSCPYQPCGAEKVFHFELVPSHPMWLNFSHPTLLHLNQNYSSKPWLAEISTNSADDDQWVKIIILSGPPSTKEPSLGRPAVPNPGDAPRNLNIPDYHPIHLHGHDFAVLAQCVPDGPGSCDVSKAILNTNNPPRRDVVFLPDSGYLILAFKADNPGVWLLHCHIAAHASLGLAAQIIENKALISEKFPWGWDEPLRDQCADWTSYCKNDGNCTECHLQNDSGI